MNKPSLEAAKSYLEQLDLGYICKKMCSEHYELPRWSPDLIQICEKLYKRYLWLLVKYPNEGLVPTREIDEFWHNHILYTKNYTRDCQALACRYLHHNHSDRDDEEEIAALVPLFLHTKERYFQEFGEELVVLAAVHPL